LSVRSAISSPPEFATDASGRLYVSCVLRKFVLTMRRMENALRAIAEPNRRRILQLVAGGERSAGEIAGEFSISRPAVSQHLTVLKGAGLVSERREGTKRLYSVRSEGFEDLRAFLETFWGDGLERLKIAAEHEEGRRRRGRRPT